MRCDGILIRCKINIQSDNRKFRLHLLVGKNCTVHFKFHTSKFLPCKLHISPMQMSHFSRANLTFSSAHLTFLPCKSHISPVQISHFSSAKLTFLQCKSHISSVQISHFSSANLTFLPCKSHISPVQISPFSRANLTFLLCRLNYNHFQTGRITTESWSQSV